MSEPSWNTQLSLEVPKCCFRTSVPGKWRHPPEEGLSSILLVLITRAGVGWVIQTPHPTSEKAPRPWGQILEEPGTAPHWADCKSPTGDGWWGLGALGLFPFQKRSWLLVCL